MPYRLAFSLISWRYFLNGGFLLCDDCSIMVTKAGSDSRSVRWLVTLREAERWRLLLSLLSPSYLIQDSSHWDGVTGAGLPSSVKASGSFPIDMSERSVLGGFKYTQVVNEYQPSPIGLCLSLCLLSLPPELRLEIRTHNTVLQDGAIGRLGHKGSVLSGHWASFCECCQEDNLFSNLDMMESTSGFNFLSYSW